MTDPSPFWSRRRRRTEFAVRLAACLAALPAAADPPVATVTSTPPFVVHFSTTQRFAARGADSMQTVPFLAWLEEVAVRLERALGEPLPAERGRPILFILTADPGTTNAWIRREVRTGSAGLGQIIRVMNPEKADPAEVLAASVSMMVARHVAARQAPGARDERPAVAPDWFTGGLAGSLYPSPRLALQRRMLDLWMLDGDRTLDALFGPAPGGTPFAFLPEWTTLVAWLRIRPAFPVLAGRLMDDWAAGRTLDTRGLAARIDTGWTARDLAQEWDLAIAAVRQTDAPWKLTPADLATRLREAIRTSRNRVPFVLPDDVADPITIHTLTQRRGEPWSRMLAQAMLLSVDQIPVGRDDALNRAVNGYRGVLYALMQPAPAGPAAWFDGWRLRRSLAAAERNFDDLEAVIAADPEAPAPAPPAVAPDPAAQDAGLESEAMRRIFHDGFRTPP